MYPLAFVFISFKWFVFSPVAERRSLVQLLERLASCPIGESVFDVDRSRLDKTLARLHMDGVLFYNETSDCVQLWSEGSKTSIQRFLTSQSRIETNHEDSAARLPTVMRAL